MTDKKNNKGVITMKKLILFTIVILFASIGLFGTISFNYSPIAYDGEDSSNKAISNNQIDTLVVLGAGHFLKSHSDFLLFLSKVEIAELSGANFEELLDILISVISSMENAKTTYYDLKNLAALTPYNQAVLDKLKNFDYDSFLEEKGNLNSFVFKKVKGFLSSGDVTGAYAEMSSYLDDLLKILQTLRQGIAKNIFPEISGLWELNQKYSNALFFGQYVAIIFKAIQSR